MFGWSVIFSPCPQLCPAVAVPKYTNQHQLCPAVAVPKHTNQHQLCPAVAVPKHTNQHQLCPAVAVPKHTNQHQLTKPHIQAEDIPLKLHFSNRFRATQCPFITAIYFPRQHGHITCAIKTSFRLFQLADVLRALSILITVYRDVPQCTLVDRHRRFDRNYCLLLHGGRETV